MARKSVNWIAIRTTFEQTDMPVASIANVHSVSRTAIDKRAAKEKWLVNPAREELKARRAGGSNVGEKRPAEPPEPSSAEIQPAAWRRARELYEGTRMPLHSIAEQTGISEFDLDVAIAGKDGGSGWSRFGSASSQPARSAEYRDGAMRDAATGAPEPAEPAPSPPSHAEIRATIRKVVRRDPDDLLKRAKRLKPEQLVTLARDVIDRMIAQLDDVIGNRDSIVELLDEAFAEGVVGATRYAAMFQAFELVRLASAAQRLASAAKLLVDQHEARAGKKANQRDAAKNEAEDETSPFSKRKLPPRLAASDGERV